MPGAALAAGVELGLELASQPAYRDLIRRWVRGLAELIAPGSIANVSSARLADLGD